MPRASISLIRSRSAWTGFSGTSNRCSASGPEPGPACAAGDRCKKVVRPRARRELAEWAQQVHQFSQRRAARLIPIARMTLRYRHHSDPQDALRGRLRDLAASRVRYGYRRLTMLLKREGWKVNAMSLIAQKRASYAIQFAL